MVMNRATWPSHSEFECPCPSGARSYIGRISGASTNITIEECSREIDGTRGIVRESLRCAALLRSLNMLAEQLTEKEVPNA